MCSSEILKEAESLRERGNELYRSGQYREAHSNYSAAIETIRVCIPSAAFSSTISHSLDILLSHLYHNRALTKTKLGGNNEIEEALADVRQATALDPSYVKAWLLCSRLLAKSADKDMKKVQEALDATHRVVELEQWHAEAVNMMRELVRWELHSRLESAPLLDQVQEIDIIAELCKLDTINGTIELNRLLVQCIKSLFAIQGLRNDPEAVGMEKKITEGEAKLYNALNSVFSKMVNFRMAISCTFLCINLLNQLDLSPKVKAMKVECLTKLYSAYYSGGKQNAHHAAKWIEMALQLHNDPDSEVGVSLRICAAQMRIERHEHIRCIEDLRECLQVCEHKGYHRNGADVQMKMADAYCKVGNFEVALSILKKVKCEFEEMRDVNGVCRALENIGTAHLGLNQYEEALNALTLALNHNPDPSTLFDITLQFASVYFYKSFGCLENSDKDGAETHFKRGKEYTNKARRIALELNDEQRLLNADTNLALFYASIDFYLDKSENQDLDANFFENLIARATKSKSQEIGRIYLAYFNFLFYHHQFEKAIEFGLKSENSSVREIQILNDEESILTRKESKDNLSRSKLMQLCYILIKFPEDALLVNEREKTIYFNISVNHTSSKQITIKDIKDIAFMIKSSIVVLSVCGNTLFCWLILPNKNVPIKNFQFSYRIKLQNGLETFDGLEPITIEQMRNSENLRGSRTFPPSNLQTDLQSENVSKMFDVVFQNIEADLNSEGISSMVIVPDGEQYYERFSSAKSFNKEPLCLNYSLSISPSITMIMDSNSNSQANYQFKRLLIVGDPRSNLPFAIEESKLLEALFNKKSDWEVNALIGYNANKQRLVIGLSQCDIIHIAAHANLNTDTLQVLRGSILLALSDKGIRVYDILH